MFVIFIILGRLDELGRVQEFRKAKLANTCLFMKLLSPKCRILIDISLTSSRLELMSSNLKNSKFHNQSFVQTLRSQNEFGKKNVKNKIK